MRIPSTRLIIAAAFMTVLAGCGETSSDTTSAASSTSEDAPGDSSEASDSTQDPATEATPDAPAPSPTPSPTVAEDSPQSYYSVATIGEVPELPSGDDVAIVMTATPDSGLIPMAIYNGTDGPISNLEVSGRALDGDGETLGQGSSQGFEPTYVPAGEHTFGYVYIGMDDLPADVVLDEPSIDYDEGVGDYENEVSVDVAEPEKLEDSIIGAVVNPHDIPVTGPISVQVACFNADGELTTVAGSFAERDDLEPGDSSTFEISFYGDFDCDSGVLAASGFSDDF